MRTRLDPHVPAAPSASPASTPSSAKPGMPAAQYDGINAAAQKPEAAKPAALRAPAPQAPNPKLVRSAQVLLLTDDDADKAHPIPLGKDQGVTLVLTRNPTTGFKYTFGDAPKPAERVVSDQSPQHAPNVLGSAEFGVRHETAHYSWTSQQLKKMGKSFALKVFYTRHNTHNELFGFQFKVVD